MTEDNPTPHWHWQRVEATTRLGGIYVRNMSYYNNNNQSGGSSGYYGGGQQQPPYGGEGYQQHQKQQVPNSSNFQNSYGDPNAWQQQQQQYNVNSNEQQHQPFYNQQQYVPSYVGQQQQQQQQQPQQSPAFWNPAAAANLAAFAMSTAASGGSSDGAMLDLAGAAGKSFLENSSARMIPGLERTMCALRSYFAVDNRYVMLKMKRILFPFLCKQWKRQVRWNRGRMNHAETWALTFISFFLPWIVAKRSRPNVGQCDTTGSIPATNPR